MEKHLLDFVTDNAIRNNAMSVINAIDQYSQIANRMIHVGREKGQILDKAVQDSNAHRVLELGTNYGYSALRIATQLETSAEIFTIEIDKYLAEIAGSIIHYSGLSDRINILCGSSDKLITNFSVPFDLVFIDHYANNYLPDLLLLEKMDLVQPGTIIISDNVVMFEDELTSYLAHLRSSGKYRSTLHRPSSGGDGMEISIRLDTA